MKNSILCLIGTSVALLGSYVAIQGSISQNAFILIGVVVGITVIGVLVASIRYPKHRGPLTLFICGFILLLFIPVFVALGDLASPLATKDFSRYILTLSSATVILIGTAVLSYRHYYIVKS